jgi:hypothetical protein
LRVFPIASVHDAISVALVGEEACVVRRSKNVTCHSWWGEGEDTEVPELAGTVQMSSCGCAAREDGSVTCVSDGVPFPGHVSKIRGVTDAREVSGGMESGCAVRADGEIVCWRPADAKTPRIELVDVRGIDDATHVVGGAGFGCALRSSGQVACWRC